MAIGIFLHYPDADYLTEARNALSRLNLDIQEIKADFETVSNLVPYTLQHGAESWLILFQPDYERDLLILPFPDKFLLPAEVQEEVLGPIVEELARVIDTFLPRNFRFPFDRDKRFQYVHIDVSVYSLLGSNRGQQQEQQTPQQIIHFCQETSQNIQTERNKALRRVQGRRNLIFLDQFDNVLENANDKLFERIIAQGFEEVVPEIVKEFESIMDPETKRFLITAETVRGFANKYRPPNFDYSAPGCGLWKAVERELNLSLVLHLRRQAGIVNNVYYPLKKSEPGKFPILTGEKNSVDLNEGSRNLEGITFGPMKGMLEWGHCNTVREKLEHLLSPGAIQHLLGQCGCKNAFPQILDQIIKLRNGHAHISAMSRQEFGELRNLVLSSRPRPTSSCLFNILRLKTFVLKHWARIDSPTKVKTESGRGVEFRNYNKITIHGDGSNWKLVAIHGDGSKLCIATFNTKEDAEAAHTALDNAAGTDEEWDACKFKENLEIDH